MPLIAFILGYFREKLREQPGDDWTDPHTAMLASLVHSARVTQGGQHNHG